MGQTRYPSKSRFSFKVRKHPQQQRQTTWSAATLSSIQSMLNSTQNGRCSFIFTILLVHTTTSTISTKNLFLYFSQFSPPYSSYTCQFTKSSLQPLLTLPSSIPEQFLTSLFSSTTIPTIYTKNIFPTSSIQPIQAASKDQGAGEFCED